MNEPVKNIEQTRKGMADILHRAIDSLSLSALCRLMTADSVSMFSVDGCLIRRSPGKDETAQPSPGTS